MCPQRSKGLYTESMQTTLYFHGGAGGVTGSNFLLRSNPEQGRGTTILVDCGLFQGKHSCEEENWKPFSYNPIDISYLIVTHAHIDHIGRIPKLVHEGFRGRIIGTEATKALAEPMLLDSVELLESEANRHGHEPLYGAADVAAAMEYWEGVPYHKTLDLNDGFTLELYDAGHILGSALIRISRAGKAIVFTGDLGGGNSPLLAPVEYPGGATYLVMESVYGDTVRTKDENRREQLEDIIEDTVARGGTLLIPAFSTERTQDLLFEIRALMIEKRIPSIPVFLDSPLAHKITAAFVAYPEYFAPALRERVKKDEQIFSFPQMQYTESVGASRDIWKTTGPKIILAGSGMSNGGRVVHHEKMLLPDKKSTLLIVGYQAAGSIGRRLLEGASEVTVFREKIPVRAKISSLYGYSAHMDGEELVEFVNTIAPSLKEVYVVMGEPHAAAILTQRIRDYLGVKATAPEAGEQVVLDL